MKLYSNPVNAVALTALVFVQVVFVTMVYGPIRGVSGRTFPARIRYTSMSLPYHFGNAGRRVPSQSQPAWSRARETSTPGWRSIVVALITVVVVRSFSRINTTRASGRRSAWGNPAVSPAIESDGRCSNDDARGTGLMAIAQSTDSVLERIRNVSPRSLR